MALDITWANFKRAGLRYKLAWGYTIVFSLLFGLGFSSLYFISEKYRREEFYQRLKDKTLTTCKLLFEVDEIDNKILRLLDRNTINSLYDEKILLFDSSFNLLYSSIDDTKIFDIEYLLRKLKSGKEVIEIDDGRYQIVGVRFQNKGRVYYGVAKAYDRFGRSKIAFLRMSLLVVYFITAFLLTVLSLYLSKIITRPIVNLTSDIEKFSTDKLSVRIASVSSNEEVELLTKKFNELLDKVEKAFKFQYHFIHHISHELKTPLTLMIANAETALSEKDEESHLSSLNFLRNGLMEMSYIINTMLDISKAEHQIINSIFHTIRIDELLFECIDEINYQDKAEFDLIMDESIADSELLTIKGNSRMLKMAFINLLRNAKNYSDAKKPVIELISHENGIQIKISNDGSSILESERSKLFTHLFRGENSRNKKGFGLGLVLVHRIVTLHSGSISYQLTEHQMNLFSVILPFASA